MNNGGYLRDESICEIKKFRRNRMEKRDKIRERGKKNKEKGEKKKGK